MDDSRKTFFEHLRTVHFTLVATVVVLLVAASVPSPRRYRAALDQADAVRLAASGYSHRSFEKFIEAAIAAHVSQHPGDAPLTEADTVLLDLTDKLSRKGPDWINVRFEASFPYGLPRGQKDRPICTTDNPYGTATLGWVPDAPRNLAEFRGVWDHLRPLQCIYLATRSGMTSPDARWWAQSGKAPSSQPAEDDDDKGWERIAILNTPPADPSEPGHLAGCKLTAQAAPNILLPMGARGEFVLHGNRRHDRVEIICTLQCVQVPVAGLDVFRGPGAVLSRYPADSFAATFPELDAIAKNLDTLPFDKLHEELARQADEAGATIELFGAKVPADNLRLWGTVLLLGAQAYFLLHLRNAPRAAPDEPPFPWIGAYGDRCSRGATIVTVALLPGVAYWQLRPAGPDGGDAGPYRLFEWGIIVVGGLVTAWSAAVIVRSWSRGGRGEPKIDLKPEPLGPVGKSTAAAPVVQAGGKGHGRGKKGRR